MARGVNHNWYDAAPAIGVEYNEESVEKTEDKKAAARKPAAKKAPAKKAAVSHKKADVKAEDDKGTTAEVSEDLG